MDGMNVLTHKLNPDMNSRGAQVGPNHTLETKLGMTINSLATSLYCLELPCPGWSGECLVSTV